MESQLLSPTEKGTFGLGAAHWGYGARVTGWEVRCSVVDWLVGWQAEWDVTQIVTPSRNENARSPSCLTTSPRLLPHERTHKQVINIYLEAVQGEGTLAAQVEPAKPGTDPVVSALHLCSCLW